MDKIENDRRGRDSTTSARHYLLSLFDLAFDWNGFLFFEEEEEPGGFLFGVFLSSFRRACFETFPRSYSSSASS